MARIPMCCAGAHVHEAELVLAVTTSDETNLVVCALAGMMGAKRRMARVRNISLGDMLAQSTYNKFYIDEIINPELVAAKAIAKIVEAPGSSEVADFANGRILLRAFDIPASSPLCGLKLADVRDEDFPWPFLIISIIRNNSVIIPKGIRPSTPRTTFMYCSRHRRWENSLLLLTPK